MITPEIQQKTMQVPLICPTDRALLEEVLCSYKCPKCYKSYLVKDGVACMLDKPDPFYEGHYGNQTHFLPRSDNIFHSWPLWFINSGYLWSLKKHVKAGCKVVELGCAGGVRYFGQRYSMIGCDLSGSGLRTIDFYDQLLQADAAVCIPLPDQSVDAVASSYFWEHIPPEIKPKILQECHRILKPGGKVIFLYDVRTNNPLISFYRNKAPDLYRKLFIEGDGHLGYEWPAENNARFNEAGFKIIENHGLEKTWLQSPSVYDKLAHFPDGEMLCRIAALGDTRFFYLFTVLNRILDTLVSWLPEKWARIQLTVLQKLS